MGVAAVDNIAGFATHVTISRELVRFGAWLPKNISIDAWLPKNTPVQQHAYLTRHFTSLMEWYLFLVIMFVAYGLGAYFVYRRLKKHNDQRTRRFIYGAIIVVMVICCAFYFLTPANTATDMFSYASYGRLITVYFKNPYFVPPSAFPHDETFQWVYWKNTTSIYGPVWMIASSILSLLSGPTQMDILLTFRSIALLSHLINVFLIYKGLRLLGRSEKTVAVGTLLYAWNPLVLSESILGAHNDIFMVTFLVLGFYWLAKAEHDKTFLQPRGYLLPMLGFTLATLVKFSAAPALAVCVLALFFARLQADRKAGSIVWWPALRSALIATGSSLAMIIVLYAPFWIGHSFHDIISTVTSQPSSADSINSILSTFANYNNAHQLPAYLSILKSHKLWSLLNIVAMLAPIALGCKFLWKKQDTRTVTLIVIASFAGFLITAPWFFPWYLIWIIGIVPFVLPIEKSRFTRATVVFSLVYSATAYMGYYTTWVGWRQLMLNPPQILWSVLLNLILIGVPLLAFFITWKFWPSKYDRSETEVAVETVQHTETETTPSPT